MGNRYGVFVYIYRVSVGRIEMIIVMKVKFIEFFVIFFFIWIV